MYRQINPFEASIVVYHACKKKSIFPDKKLIHLLRYRLEADIFFFFFFFDKRDGEEKRGTVKAFRARERRIE